MALVGIKEEAHRLIDRLPEGIGWDDLLHEIFVRQTIEAGLADSNADNGTDVEELRVAFGLSG